MKKNRGFNLCDSEADNGYLTRQKSNTYCNVTLQLLNIFNIKNYKIIKSEKSTS